MREKLQALKNVRATFRGRVAGFGQRTSHGHPKPMILVRDVRDRHGAVLTDHVWFNQAKWIENLGLQPGDEIEFDARVRSYWKGYIEKHLDYKLSHPTNVRKLNEPHDSRTHPLFTTAA